MSLDEYITIRQRNAEVILAAVEAKQDVAMYDAADLSSAVEVFALDDGNDYTVNAFIAWLNEHPMALAMMRNADQSVPLDGFTPLPESPILSFARQLEALCPPKYSGPSKCGSGIQKVWDVPRKGNFVCVGDKTLEIPSFMLAALADLEAERVEATVREFLGIINEHAARATAGMERPGLLQMSRLHPVPVPDWRRGQHGQDRTE